MNMEISEEAKRALANRAQVEARMRLVRDGCHTDAAMQRRVLLLAAERNFPSAEYAKLMHKRIMMKSIQEFCRDERRARILRKVARAYALKSKNHIRMDRDGSNGG
jgi:hypothetical protein